MLHGTETRIVRKEMALCRQRWE